MAIIYGFLGEYFLAVEKFNNCIELNKGFVVGWYGLGIARFMLRNYSHAARAFNKALDAFDAINPEERMTETHGVSVNFFEIGRKGDTDLNMDKTTFIERKQTWNLEREHIAWNAEVSYREREKQKQKSQQPKGVSDATDPEGSLHGLPFLTLFAPPDHHTLSTCTQSLKTYPNKSLQETGLKVHARSPLRKEVRWLIEGKMTEDIDLIESENRWTKRMKHEDIQYRAQTFPLFDAATPFRTGRWSQEGERISDIEDENRIATQGLGKFAACNGHQFISQYTSFFTASPEDCTPKSRLVRPELSPIHETCLSPGGPGPQSAPIDSVPLMSVPVSKPRAFTDSAIQISTGVVPGQWEKRKNYVTDYLFTVNLEEIESQKVADAGDEKKETMEEDELGDDRVKNGLDKMGKVEMHLDNDSRGCSCGYSSNEEAELESTDSSDVESEDEMACSEQDLVPSGLFTTRDRTSDSAQMNLPPLPIRSYNQSPSFSSSSTPILAPLTVHQKQPSNSLPVSNHNRHETKTSTGATPCLGKTSVTSFHLQHSKNYNAVLPWPEFGSNISPSTTTEAYETHGQQHSSPDGYHDVSLSSVVSQVEMVDKGLLGLTFMSIKNDNEDTNGPKEGEEVLRPRIFEGFVGMRGRR